MNEMVVREKQNSQSGQALVENVLLLLIAIALIVGLTQQIYRPFGNWMKDYMGAYLDCLLDRGELPTVGGSSVDSGECNSQFKSFSMQNGRPPINPSQNNGGSSDRSSSNSASESVRKSSQSSSSNSSSSSGRSSSRRSPIPVGNRSAADGVGSKAENQIMEKLPESQFFKRRSYGSSASNSIPRSQQQLIVGGKRYGIEDNKEAKEKSVSVPVVASGEDGQSPKKLIVKPPERKPTAEEADQPWSFAEYIKFALILLIIIAIILFLGGQILQISKSMEK